MHKARQINPNASGGQNSILQSAGFGFFLTILAPILILSACIPNQPDDKLLKIRLEKELNQPFQFEITSLSVDWARAGEKRLEGSFDIILKTASPIYIKADLKQALEVAGLKSSEIGVLNHALAAAKKLPEPLQSQILEQAPSNRVDAPQYVQAVMRAGTELSGSGHVTAVMDADGWRFDFAPGWRSNLFPEIKKLDSPYFELRSGLMDIEAQETKAYLTAGVEETAQYAKVVESATAQVAKEAEQRRQASRAKMLKLVHPGALFSVTRHSVDRVKEIGFLSVDAVGGSERITGNLLDPQDPDKKEAFTAYTEFDADFNAVLRLTAENKTIDFHMRDDGFVEKQPQNGVYLALTAVSQAEVEKVLELGRQRLQAENKKREDYQILLTQTIAAGRGFQGSLTGSSGQNGAIGLAIEMVVNNGLSCTGYLFDPSDRSLKKPFQGSLNKAYAANNALTIALKKGTGLKDDSRRYNDFQRNWLSERATHSITLKLNGRSLEGTTNNNIKVALAPIDNFPELLAQDRADEQKRQDRIKNAVASGQAWSGTFNCNSNGSVGEVGLFFDTFTGSSCKGYVFDPNDPSKRKNFNGSISLDKSIPWAIQLNVPRGSGLKQYDGIPEFQKNWLRSDGDYKLFINAFENVLRGESSSRCAIKLKPIADYKAVLKQFDTAAKEKLAQAEAAIEPLTIYSGIWKASDAQGEIMLKINSRSMVTFTASAYDPKAPTLVWNFSGSIISKPNGDVSLRLVPIRNESRLPTLRQPSTAWMLKEWGRYEGHAWDLNVTEGGLEGEWAKRFPITLNKVYSPLNDKSGAEKKTAAPKGDQAENKYPPLKTDDKGAPIAAAHLIDLDGQKVRLALQVLAPDKTVARLRIDNIGGAPALWQSNSGDKQALIKILDGDSELVAEAGAINLKLSNKEKLLELRLTDNGSFKVKKSDYRITIFFDDGQRAQCILVHRQDL